MERRFGQRAAKTVPSQELRKVSRAMEACCKVAINLELSSLFSTLLQLSTEEVVAIWDAVSAYILGQLKLNKGVMITGLGTFAMVEEQFRGEEEVYVIRRPIFQLDTDALCLQEVMVTTEVIPGNVTIEPLDYRQISQATSLLQQVVKSCVQETILLYSLHLRNRQHPSFAFKDIGVLSCKDNILYMWFYYDCVTGLESKAGQIALLHTRLWMPDAAVSGGTTTARWTQTAPAHAFPSFQLVATKSYSPWYKKAVEEERIRRGTRHYSSKLQQRQPKFSLAVLPSQWSEAEMRPGLQRRVRFSLPMLPSQRPSIRQQDTGKMDPASVLPPCPGSSPRKQEAGRQKPPPPARRPTVLPSSEVCKTALQEVWQLSAEWERVKAQWQEWQQQVKAEWAVWKAWSAGEVQQPPEPLDTGGTWTPCPPSQPSVAAQEKGGQLEVEEG